MYRFLPGLLLPQVKIENVGYILFCPQDGQVEAAFGQKKKDEKYYFLVSSYSILPADSKAKGLLQYVLVHYFRKKKTFTILFKTYELNLKRYG